MTDKPTGFISSIVEQFLHTRFSLVLVIFSVLLGGAAVLLTPREEEPQIVVPMADIYVNFPGASPGEVEKLVATPLEKLLWQIDGVEDVYSISYQDRAIVTVRFFVGEDRERSIVKLRNMIEKNIDRSPPGVTGWVVKPVEIDDVPIVNLALYSQKYDDFALRRIAEEVLNRLTTVEDISGEILRGGRAREVRVELDPQKMAGFNISPLQVYQSLQAADVSVTAGDYTSLNHKVLVSSESFLSSVNDVKDLVVGVHNSRPVYLQDIAQIIDGPQETQHYTRIGFSDYERRFTRSPDNLQECYSAVVMALAKKKGTNAVWVADSILDKMREIEAQVLPQGVHYEITRNYGQTAQTKVNDLLSNLFFAVLTVVLLLAITLGWREAAVVALAVPVSFSLALFVNYALGYTINRVTLFALILSLGLVVDDPITNVDNIQRHILQGKKKPRLATLFAVAEVLPPVLMSTLAIILSFAPLFFITGMMGPYMAPMAANVPLTVVFSTVCALTIVPWMSHLLLKNKSVPVVSTGHSSPHPGNLNRFYRAIVGPLLESRLKRWILFIFIGGLLIACLALAGLRQVPLKMLPFDNKNEFSLVVDMPEGTSLEMTDRCIRDMEKFLRTVPEITNFVSYVGLSSPMDFNGLVRHYYLRENSNLAEIRVNLAPKEKREQQSHALVLRLRRELENIAHKNEAKLKIVESPPGPPVLSTLVAEIYGPLDASYQKLIAAGDKLKKVMGTEPFVVDIDDSSEAQRDKLDFMIDKEKAALHGISSSTIVDTLRLSLHGAYPGLVHEKNERQALKIRLRLPRNFRSNPFLLGQIKVRTSSGKMLPLAELGEFEFVPVAQPIYHKNLKPVVMVMAEMAGRAPGEAVLDIQARLKNINLGEGIDIDWAGEGEWKITLDVFRDLGLANGVSLLGIYILLVLQTGSMAVPMLIMLAIPLTLLGIMPGFWLLNLFFAQDIGGFNNPVFFTATSMIGMIALGGIVIRNSLVLIEFIQESLQKGMPLKEAILQSGTIRLRPIVLTALTTGLGAWPITLDPIFSGLAWALIFGLLASTMFTLVLVPVVYYMAMDKKG